MVQNSLQPKRASGNRSLANGKAELPTSSHGITQKAPLAGSAGAFADKWMSHGPTFLRDMLRCGERDYVRDRDLPGLLHMFPSELRNLEMADGGAILKKLCLALRAERRRGRAAHYRYSLMRHIALMQAVAAEKRSCMTNQPIARDKPNKQA